MNVESNKEFKKDVIGWDITNWGKSLDFFDENIDYNKINKALEIGSGNYGGYSLYLGAKGIKTVCSNPEGKFVNIKNYHKKYRINITRYVERIRMGFFLRT